MLIGYARVSTQDQHPDFQLDALKAAGCEQVFQEKMTGKLADRPELVACLRTLRKGDILVVWKLDRLGRSLKHLVEIIHDLEQRGVAFRSLTVDFRAILTPVFHPRLTPPVGAQPGYASVDKSTVDAFVSPFSMTSGKAVLGRLF